MLFATLTTRMIKACPNELLTTAILTIAAVSIDLCLAESVPWFYLTLIVPNRPFMDRGSRVGLVTTWGAGIVDLDFQFPVRLRRRVPIASLTKAGIIGTIAHLPPGLILLLDDIQKGSLVLCWILSIMVVVLAVAALFTFLMCLSGICKPRVYGGWRLRRRSTSSDVGSRVFYYHTSTGFDKLRRLAERTVPLVVLLCTFSAVAATINYASILAVDGKSALPSVNKEIALLCVSHSTVTCDLQFKPGVGICVLAASLTACCIYGVTSVLNRPEPDGQLMTLESLESPSTITHLVIDDHSRRWDSLLDNTESQPTLSSEQAPSNPTERYPDLICFPD